MQGPLRAGGWALSSRALYMVAKMSHRHKMWVCSFCIQSEVVLGSWVCYDATLMGKSTNLLEYYKLTGTLSYMKIKKIKNFDMNKNTYALRRKVINLFMRLRTLV